MDQSKSNNGEKKSSEAAPEIRLPARGFSVEFFVGVFALIGIACAGYLSVGLAGIQIFASDTYELRAKFDNISGLKHGASVEIAGVPVGEVADIVLEDPVAVIIMRIHKGIKIRDDDIFLIRTKGIIGDRYVKISRGASDVFIPEGGTVSEKGESIVDIEDLLGKFVHNFGSDSETKND